MNPPITSSWPLSSPLPSPFPSSSISGASTFTGGFTFGVLSFPNSSSPGISVPLDMFTGFNLGLYLTLVFVYGLNLNEANYDKKVELNNNIEKNIKTYTKIYNSVLKGFIKPFKPKKFINQELDSNAKIKLCLELIFSQSDLIYRNSLLSKFISLYGREPNKDIEDKHFFYNIATYML